MKRKKRKRRGEESQSARDGAGQSSLFRVYKRAPSESKEFEVNGRLSTLERANRFEANSFSLNSPHQTTSSNMSMSLVGLTTLRSAVQASPRPLLAVGGSVQIPSSRPFSTTPLRLLATPQTGRTNVGRDPHAAEHVRKAVAQQQIYTPDYSKGPSALDKASSLFFFTEIVRGELDYSCSAISHTELTRVSFTGMAVVLEQVR